MLIMKPPMTVDGEMKLENGVMIEGMLRGGLILLVGWVMIPHASSLLKAAAAVVKLASSLIKLWGHIMIGQVTAWGLMLVIHHGTA